MAFCDFRVKWDPDTETQDVLVDKILYAVLIKNKLKAHKPCKISLRGDSGEGKSMAALTLMYRLLLIQGLTYEEIVAFFSTMNVYEPREYGPKLKKILFDKKFKKLNVFTIHEARNLVSATRWQSFVNVAIADISQQAREIKEILSIIISQDWNDISKSLRRTFQFAMSVRRPAFHKARLKIQVLWKLEKDIENSKIVPRPLQGYYVLPSGKHIRFTPSYIEIPMPPKELVEIFKKQDREAKSQIIEKKLDDVMKDINAEIGDDSGRIKHIIDHYTSDADLLLSVGKRRKNKLALNKNFKEMHDLTDKELKLVESAFNTKFQEINKKYEGVE